MAVMKFVFDAEDPRGMAGGLGRGLVRVGAQIQGRRRGQGRYVPHLKGKQAWF